MFGLFAKFQDLQPATTEKYGEDYSCSSSERPLGSIVGISLRQKSPGDYSLQMRDSVQSMTVCSIFKTCVCGWI